MHFMYWATEQYERTLAGRTFWALSHTCVKHKRESRKVSQMIPELISGWYKVQPLLSIKPPILDERKRKLKQNERTPLQKVSSMFFQNETWAVVMGFKLFISDSHSWCTVLPTTLCLNGNAVSACDINHFAFHHHFSKSSPFKDISVNPNTRSYFVLFCFINK